MFYAFLKIIDAYYFISGAAGGDWLSISPSPDASNFVEDKRSEDRPKDYQKNDPETHVFKQKF